MRMEPAVEAEEAMRRYPGAETEAMRMEPAMEAEVAMREPEEVVEAMRRELPEEAEVTTRRELPEEAYH